LNLEEKYKFGGWKNCLRLFNNEIELIATADIGPRIVRFGYIDGQNLFKEFKEDQGKTGGLEWRAYGGHRLWHAPEDMTRTYYPDNETVKYSWDGKTLKLMQNVEKTTGILKEIQLTLDSNENKVTIFHKLTNKNLWEIELVPWSPTIMAGKGRMIVPQEQYQSWEDNKLPVRTLILWSYTDMSDLRWKWGKKYIQLNNEHDLKTKQKIGMANTAGWISYYLNGEIFIKRYAYEPHAKYPDLGCNTEVFTDYDLVEIETLGRAQLVKPGESAVHTEKWYLFKAEIQEDEISIDNNLLPLLKNTEL
jgi:hypothetical protein